MLRTRLLVILGLVATIAYLASSARSSFIAHDEGLLGQTAERVLAGETPHLDFEDPYTGGLTYLNALAFKTLGARSSSLRVMLLGFAAVFVVCCYLLARRSVPRLAATGVVMVATLWSLKNYFAGLPSWYNLFFAIFGALALVLDSERRGPRYLSPPLFVAGLMGGLSVVIKITGLYFVAAGLLYVLFDAQTDGPRGRRRLGLADLCTWLAPPVVLLLLLGLLANRPEAMDILGFLLPATLVATLPWIARRARPAEEGSPDDRWFLARSLQFLLGALLPPAVFVAALVAEHGTKAAEFLYRGIFELPRLRFAHAEFSLPPLSSLVVAAPFLCLCLPAVQRRLQGWLPLAMVASALAALLAFAGSTPAVYQAVWAPMRSLAPVFVALAAIQLIASQGRTEGDRRRFLLAATTAFLSLGQFPYSSGLYFAYTAPVLALLVADVWRDYAAGRRVQVLLAAFLSLFALLYLNRADVRSLGYRYEAQDQLELLAPEKVNLLVPAVQRRGYEAIMELVRRQTGPQDGIWAGPDAPEIYFMTGKQNPTRRLYEFFDPDWEAGVLDVTSRPEIRLIVLHHRPEFTAPMSPETAGRLARRFPEGVQIGPMEVRWRQGPPNPGPPNYRRDPLQ